MQSTWQGRLMIAAGGSLLAAGGVWLLSLFWRCPILYYTGIPCPSCGMTRATLSLLRLDFAGAAAFNPLVFVAGGYYLVLLLAYITGHGKLLKSPWYWGSLVVAFLVYGVWRLL